MCLALGLELKTSGGSQEHGSTIAANVVWVGCWGGSVYSLKLIVVFSQHVECRHHATVIARRML